MEGISNYRFKMVDKDVTFAYSSIKNADFQGTGVKLYPNPVSNVLFLKDIDLKSVKELDIINISGVTVYNAGFTAGVPVSADGINVANLTNGTYIVKVIKTGGALSTHKIVVSK